MSKLPKSLQDVIGTINKSFGECSVIELGTSEKVDVEVIPTGSLSLDIATGVGGYPKGRIIEIVGQESSGKTTLALHAIAECQALGGRAVFIDAEHSLDVAYANAIGVDTDRLIISQPGNGDEALEFADRLIRSGEIGIIVIDSVAALTPKQEIDGEMGESKMGLHARLMSQAMRKMVAEISKTKTLCIFINQFREKIGIVYGNPNVTTGGNALKFYATMRLDVKKRAEIKVGEDVVGNKTTVNIFKNKVAPPSRRAEFDLIYGVGVYKLGEILDVAVKKGVVTLSGSWYKYGETKLGQGRERVLQILSDNEELVAEIESKLKA